MPGVNAKLIRCLALVSTVFGMAAEAEPAPPRPIRLVENPNLSPDGNTLAFAWQGDIWLAPSQGGEARPFTRHPARESEPCFSPDGRWLAFVSDRTGSRQIHVAPVAGGAPSQVTQHTAGYALLGWFPDGQSLLASGQRDHYWRHAERFLRVYLDTNRADQVLFDDYGANGSLSPDGQRLLFTREGVAWWRKGYHGSGASQIWQYDLRTGKFDALLRQETDCRHPVWKPDGQGFYFASAEAGSLNLWEYEFAKGTRRPLTRLEDDAVLFPTVARAGNLVVFRHLFDLYSYHPGTNELPRKLAFQYSGDALGSPVERRWLEEASEVAFTADGLEMAFIAGHDLYVMDTVLKEPVAVTRTAGPEGNPVFSADGHTLFFTSWQDGQCDLWRAERTDPAKCWWQNESFRLVRLTQDADVESRLRLSPDGTQLAFVKGRGDLWVMEAAEGKLRRLLPGWDAPDYDWSPDGKWLVYARYDNDFNRDVWLWPIDNARPPFNLSRHPNNESDPVWSPDGKLIAFLGRRGLDEVNIQYVWLEAGNDEKSTRDRTLEEALDKIKKAREKKKEAAATPAGKKAEDRKNGETAREEKPKAPEETHPPEVKIDFDGIHERIQHIHLTNAIPRGLFWSADSKKLAFAATLDGKPGTYTVEIPKDLKPKLLSPETGTQARWLKEGDQVAWLSGGKPTTLSARGELTRHAFRARQEINRPEKNRAVFDLAWQTMRDFYYDERLGNRNWDAVRRKYRDQAAEAFDAPALALVIQLMLGELNGSHLGFTPAEDSAWTPPQKWPVETAHLGLRFDPAHPGPGLKVRDVLPKGPAAQAAHKIQPGEVILSIDGVTVDPGLNLAGLLNGPLARDIRLKVRPRQGEDREVVLRPVSYTTARTLLADQWVKDNRQAVDKASHGTLGYLHIPAMDWPSFQQFQADLYAAGAGKDGLIIDVRENPGGFTTDHLLTALMQPQHGITVPRGGGPGYPQDRTVYATWTKPVTVLCNQYSGSNAEIFSHAIKNLKRGQLVGVTTMGAVISTGSAQLMDAGVLRLPHRGFFVLQTGEDMELNGAVPDHPVWPEPGQLPRGEDPQLSKAIEVLQRDVATWQKRPETRLRKASERQ